MAIAPVELELASTTSPATTQESRTDVQEMDRGRKLDEPEEGTSTRAGALPRRMWATAPLPAESTPAAMQSLVLAQSMADGPSEPVSTESTNAEPSNRVRKLPALEPPETMHPLAVHDTSVSWTPDGTRTGVVGVPSSTTSAP